VPEPAEPLEQAGEDIDPVEPAEEPTLSDAEFLRGLRADMEGVRDGTVQSIADATRPPIKQRPWGRRHKIRDKHGRAY
jgi:hypothetical protein